MDNISLEYKETLQENNLYSIICFLKNGEKYIIDKSQLKGFELFQLDFSWKQIGWKIHDINEFGIQIRIDLETPIDFDSKKFLFIKIFDEEREKKRTQFMNEYKLNHACCPNCGHKDHSSTLMGFIYNADDPHSYKDMNRCVCSNCGDKHLYHDRVKSTKI